MVFYHTINKKINKYGFQSTVARLPYTNNKMVCITDDGGITFKYFSRNAYGSMSSAKKASEEYMRSVYKTNSINAENNFSHK